MIGTGGEPSFIYGSVAASAYTSIKVASCDGGEQQQQRAETGHVPAVCVPSAAKSQKEARAHASWKKATDFTFPDFSLRVRVRVRDGRIAFAGGDALRLDGHDDERRASWRTGLLLPLLLAADDVRSSFSLSLSLRLLPLDRSCESGSRPSFLLFSSLFFSSTCCLPGREKKKMKERVGGQGGGRLSRSIAAASPRRPAPTLSPHHRLRHHHQVPASYYTVTVTWPSFYSHVCAICPKPPAPQNLATVVFN